MRNRTAPHLLRDVQRIHNLPDHEGEDVNNQKHTDCRIELPGLQMLLEYTKTKKSPFLMGRIYSGGQKRIYNLITSVCTENSKRKQIGHDGKANSAQDGA